MKFIKIRNNYFCPEIISSCYIVETNESKFTIRVETKDSGIFDIDNIPTLEETIYLLDQAFGEFL